MTRVSEMTLIWEVSSSFPRVCPSSYFATGRLVASDTSEQGDAFEDDEAYDAFDVTAGGEYTTRMFIIPALTNVMQPINRLRRSRTRSPTRPLASSKSKRNRSDS